MLKVEESSLQGKRRDFVKTFLSTGLHGFRSENIVTVDK